MKSFKSSFLLVSIYVLAFSALTFHLLDTFNYFKKSLQHDQLMAWYGLFGLTFCLFGLGISQAIYEWKSGKQYIHFSLLNIVGLLGYLCFYIFSHNGLIPIDMAGFMFNEINVYGIFLSIVIGLGLFWLIKLASINRSDEAVKGFSQNFGIAFFVPALAYFVYKFVVSAFNTPETINISFIVTFFVLLTTSIIYLIIRGLVHAKFIKSPKFQLVFKILFTLVFPIIGIVLNHTLDDFTNNIFGDFMHPLIIILLIFTAILLIYPIENLSEEQRITAFYLKLICLPYSLYFTLIFLPFLPLSIVGTIVFGIGLLLLSPIVLLIIHIQSIADDFQFLNQDKKRISYVLSGFAFAIIPLIVLTTMFTQAEQLQEVIAYSEKYNSAENAKPKQYDKDKIYSIVNTVTKQTNNRIGREGYLPFITPLRNKIVTNRLFLKIEKSNRIQEIFTGYSNYQLKRDSRANYRSSTSALENFSTNTETVYNNEKGYYETWVHFSVTNDATGWQSEFVSLIDIPDGVYINNMYLDIGDRREYALMAEKKAADWLYNQIKIVRQDPAILKYVGKYNLSFSIYPIARNETRTAGIQFIHMAPTDIKVKERSIPLGEQKDNHPVVETTHTLYVPATTILPTTIREPKPKIFVGNFSSEPEWIYFSNKIKSLAQEYNLSLEELELTLVGSYHKVVTAKEFLDGEPSTISGGFFLEKSLFNFFNQYEPSENSFPRIHVITNQKNKIVMNESIAYLSGKVPEENYMHIHTPDADDILLYNPLEQPITSPEVRVYIDNEENKHFIPLNHAKAIVKQIEAVENDWQTGAIIQEQHTAMVFNPSQTDKLWRQEVYKSINTNVLSPSTALMSLENEMQKVMLKKKQQQVLKGDAAFDAEGDQFNQMDEPMWLFFLLPFFLYWISKRMNGRNNLTLKTIQ